MQHQYSQFFVQNWPLILLLFVILVSILRLEVENSALALTPQEMTLWMNREPTVTVLDIREQEQFEQGHINGAKQITPDFSDKQNPWTKYKKKKVVLVCEDGSISKRIRDKVADNVGHQDVKYLQGGMGHWLEENFPVAV